MSDEMLEHFHRMRIILKPVVDFNSKFKGDKMELVVERVSQTGNNAGRGLKSGGKWYSAGKSLKGDFKHLHPGDAIEAEVTGDFINGYKLVSNAAPSAPHTQEKGQAPSNPAPTNKDGQISRGASLKAVLGSLYANSLVKDMGEDEAVAKLISISEKFAQYMRDGVKA